MFDLDIHGAPLIAHGASGQVFALPDDHILKLFHDAVSDEMIEREASIAILAHALALPVAPPLQRVRSDGRRGIVYPHLRGETMLQAVRKTPWRGPTLFDAMARLQRDIHGHVVAGIRAVGDVLETDILHGPAPIDLRRAALAHLASLPQARHLLHGDLHPGNIILTQKGPFVIDWGKATMGPAAADIVRTEMLLRFGQGGADLLTNMWRDWAAARLKQAAVRADAVSEVDLKNWRPIVALAWMRARPPVRQGAFLAYLNRALHLVGLPKFVQ